MKRQGLCGLGEIDLDRADCLRRGSMIFVRGEVCWGVKQYLTSNKDERIMKFIRMNNISIGLRPFEEVQKQICVGSAKADNIILM